MGRPSSITPEIENKILELVSVSSMGLEKICNSDPELPHTATVRRHIAENETFRDRYARAKEEQADVLADEIISLADEIDGDTATFEKIGVVKLRIESRKWTAAKLKPKKYGEKIDHTNNGKDFTPSIVFISADTLTDEQLDKYTRRESEPKDE